MAASSLPRNTSPNVPAGDAAALLAGNTAFATDLYATLRNESAFTGKNLFFSPYSISVALAMTYAGARGATASELQKTMHFTLPNDRLHTAFDALDLALTSPRTPSGATTPFILRFANSLWGSPTATDGKPFVFKQPFLDTLATDYGTGVRLADFINAPDAARTTINNWVAGQTENKILNLLSPDAINRKTRFVLVNAAYFHGGWLMPFPPEATAAGTFHGAKGDTTAQMMTITDKFSYGAGHGWRAVALPYDGGLTFTAILPDKLSAFESSLNAAKLAGIQKSLKFTQVNLTMPKFTMPGVTFSLKDALRALGTTALFTRDADLSGISTSETTNQTTLAISDVLHQAFISVDEKSTEAAAATAVIGMQVAAARLMPPQPVVLTLDKPFVFFISDDATGAILFMGRYVGG